MVRWMRVVTICAIAMLVSLSNAEAQSPLKFGFKGGLNIADFSGDDADGTDSRTGLVLGVFTNVGLMSGLSLQPELLYVQKGATVSAYIDPVELDMTIKLDYLEIPLLLKYGLQTPGRVSPCFFAGPAIAFIMSSKTGVDVGLGGYSVSQDIDNNNHKSTDIGLVFGGGVDISLGRSSLGFDIRYTLGMNGVWEDVDPAEVPEDEIAYAYSDGTAFDMKNKSIAMTAGIRF